jgi:hypothetical protein
MGNIGRAVATLVCGRWDLEGRQDSVPSPKGVQTILLAG